LENAAATREAQAEEIRKAKAEKERLERLRQYGRELAWMAPPEYQAKVARDLLAGVTTEEFPSELGHELAYHLVARRVDVVLQPWRDAEEQERVSAKARRKVEHLIAMGISHGYTKTWNWHSEDANRARRQIERDLRDEVEPDWTSEDVQDLVDDVLEEWEEETWPEE
jgi:hypothetical protein